MEQTPITKIAAEFVELMREDFRRSFELKDFLRYARPRLADDVDEMVLEQVGYEYFGKHYDLARLPLGSAWSFVRELEAPEPPGAD